jgi:hypothetical protein
MSILHEFSAVSFSTKTTLEPEELRVRLTGNADMNVVTGLGGYLKNLHGEVVRKGLKRVVVDLRELYFMNSSCLKALVTWVTTVEETSPTSRYRIAFVQNQNLHWQRRSLDALRNLGGDTVDVLS